jgi:hypothetical protein
VSEAAERFRARAKQCRQLARDARDQEARETLGQMADELDAEAGLIDSAEGSGQAAD